MSHRITASLFAAVASCAGMQTAHAVPTLQERTTIATAVALCQPALPVFDGNIRKRPLAVQNEGTSNAFVSCGLIEDVSGYSSGAKTVAAYLVNTGTTSATINCTLVSGNGRHGDSVLYFPKSATISAGDNSSLIFWSAAADNGGVNFDQVVSVSCQLPPGTGVMQLTNAQDVDVGP